ncbi:MAG: alkyl sulfatase dimerization domain-containing protein [Actinomycetes bacterium]
MPTRAPGPSEPTALEVAPGTWFVRGWVNVAAFATDDGLVLVDAGRAADARRLHAAVRSVTDLPLHTVVFTHGHVDHAFGLRAFWEAGDRPRVVAHAAVAERFRRYTRTAAHNARINAVQFGVDPAALRWPSTDADFAWPDLTYTDALDLTIGGETFCLRHARGETDDGTWVWVPARKVLACGDLFIGVAPNAGNPQKVQRYPEEWADASETLAGLGAEVMLPGHSDHRSGAAEIHRLFTLQAEYLRCIVEQTLAGLNAGLRHDEIVAALVLPAHLLDEPTLQPLYDRPEFIARNVIRKYGGWWNGSPADLLPAPEADRATEIATLAGGTGALVARARTLLATGDTADLRLACHLAEWAGLAAPHDPDARACVREVFGARAAAESSLMGRGIFGAAVRATTDPPAPNA